MPACRPSQKASTLSYRDSDNTSGDDPPFLRSLATLSRQQILALRNVLYFARGFSTYPALSARTHWDLFVLAMEI